MNKKKASEVLFFKIPDQENLHLFLGLAGKASKGVDMIVETKLSSVSIKLFGEKDKVTKTSSNIRHYYGLLKTASRVNHTNQRTIPSELITILAKETPDKNLLAGVLTAKGFSSRVSDDSIITSSSLTTVIKTTKHIAQRLRSTLPGEPRNIRKFMVLLSFKFPQSTIEDLINFGIMHNKIGNNENGYYFMSSSEDIYELYCNNYTPHSSNQLSPTAQPDISNPLSFRGGSISIRKK